MGGQKSSFNLNGPKTVYTIHDEEIAFPHTPIVVCYRGSHSHGTYIPPEDPLGVDDVDLFAACIASADNYLGLKHWEGADYWHKHFDIVTYDVKKFFQLLLKGNPNCIGLLWLRPQDYLVRSLELEIILNHRQLFLGKKPICDAFAGYARGQLKRMTHFSANPYARYMGEKRKKLVDQFGFDCKNAAHLIRLLKMCKEFLETGTFQVYRKHDAQEIIAIKTGKWELHKIHELSNELFADVDRLYPFADIPEYPDKEAVNKLLVNVLEDHFYGPHHLNN
jgi:predicted nucleotidyltransferase